VTLAASSTATDRVVVLTGGQAIEVRCAGCSDVSRPAVEPTGQFIEGVQAFAQRHAACD
jgi:hypothetical protein